MVYLTALIFVEEGKEEVFHQYEAMVLPILDNYKGQLIYRIRPTRQSYVSSVSEELPYELHFISFESEEDFSDFSNDERRKKFLDLKEASMRSSLVVMGHII